MSILGDKQSGCPLRRVMGSIAVATLLLAASATSAPAQQDPRIAAAKAKGKVSWYTAIAPDEMRKELIDEFKRRTGLEVVVYYGGTGQVVSRLSTERKTKTYGVDVVTLGDLDLVAQLRNENALQAYRLKDTSAIQSGFVDKDAYWYGICFWTLALTYNKDLAKGAAPTSWVELADPKWKGKLAIVDPARGAGGFMFLKAMVADQGWGWIEALMKNQPFVSALAPGIEQAIANGERTVGTSVSSYASGTMKDKGPIAVAPVEALLASPMTVSMVADAPNPEGGELLLEFLMTKDAAASYAKHGWFSSRTDDVPAPYGFDASAGRKVKFATVPSTLSRQEYLEKFNAIAQSVKK